MPKLPPSKSYEGNLGSNKRHKPRGNWGSDKKPPTNKGCGGKKTRTFALLLLFAGVTQLIAIAHVTLDSVLSWT